MSLNRLPNEVLCTVSRTLYTKDIQSLRCACREFLDIFSDEYLLDMKGIKLYDHQMKGVKFLLDRESKGLKSILNFDTGIGKTATILYAYLSCPVSTVIILKPKFVIIWKKELEKYKIVIPILTVSQSKKADLSIYKRFIFDEIHEKMFTNREERTAFANRLKHGVIWGLTASNVQSVSGGFRYVHLIDFFDKSDCMMTVPINSLDKVIRSAFALPNFSIINTISWSTGIKDTKTYSRVSEHIQDTIWNHWSSHLKHYQFVNEYGRLDVIYNSEVHNIVNRTRDEFVPEGINNNGVVTIDGIAYSNFSVDQWRQTYRNSIWEVSKVLDVINIENKRTIIYSCSNDAMKRVGYDENMLKLRPVKLCELFMEGKINTLVIPDNFNAGYNFGRIDVVIIYVRGLDYRTFKQIMGRINRLDQHNTTDVYLIVDDGWEETAHALINKYKNEFV